MRTFRILVVDEKDEIVVDFPVSAKTTHNGLGGGTDTALPNLGEKKAIVRQLVDLRKEIFKVKPATDMLNKENDDRQSEETQK